MKKILILTFLACTALAATAQEFDAVCSTGQTLHYTVIGNPAQHRVAVSCPTGSQSQMTGTVAIPSSVTYEGNNYTVSSFKSFAFLDCNQMTEVIFPPTIDTIREHAFYQCTALGTLSLPNSVIYIGEYAFSKCYGIQDTLIIPDNVTFIGNNAFSNCTSITAIDLPESITAIEDFTFKGCSSLSSPVTIPNNVKVIGTEAFFECINLKGVTLSESLKLIKTGAFERCNSLSGTLVLPDSINNIQNMAFYFCKKLTGIHFGKSLSTIGYCAFGGCSSIVRLEIPNTITEIGEMAFIDCSNLTRLTLPRTLTHVGSTAFCGCPHLARITCYATVPPTMDSTVFDTVSPNLIIYVPCGYVESYRSSDTWRNFTNYAETYNISIVIQSNDETMGSVDISEYPTCESLYATFSATPNRGYLFSHWNDGDTHAVRTVAVSEDVIFTAYFEEDPNNPIGISDILQTAEPTVTAQKGIITIQNEQPFRATVYDLMGRTIYRTPQSVYHTVIPVPTTGIYLVQTNGRVSRKVWVQR